MLPTFQSWTVRKIIECLTQGLLSSHWNIYHDTTAYFFEPPCRLITLSVLFCWLLVQHYETYVSKCNVECLWKLKEIPTFHFHFPFHVHYHCQTAVCLYTYSTHSNNESHQQISYNNTCLMNILTVLFHTVIISPHNWCAMLWCHLMIANNIWS